MTHSAKWNSDKIKKHLVGGRIIQEILDVGDGKFDDPYFGMVVEFPDKTRKAVWILSDDEGNGCGGLDITDIE